jgi:hypothetical protein
MKAVRDELTRDKQDGGVGIEAFTRLDSLAKRYQATPAGQRPSEPSSPAAAPPGRDPELAAGRSVR